MIGIPRFLSIVQAINSKTVETEARKVRYKIKKSGLIVETAAILWQKWINVDEESRWTSMFQQDE